MARYLLSGVAGFIASRTAEMLLDQGHEVVGIDTVNDAYDVRLKRFRLKRLEGRDGLTVHDTDICDFAALKKLCAESDPFAAVINLAARAGVRQSVENPWAYMETNATGALNLLELARRNNVPKFVLASTSSLYGQHNEVPYREDADTGRPLSPYAASKKAAEALCHTYHHLYGIDVTVFRYFTVYGPAGRPDMSIFRFIQWVNEGRPATVFGDGRQSRDFTYVDDIARGTVLGLKPLGFETINLGSGRPAVLMDVLRLIERELDKKANIEYRPMHKADVLATWADVGRAKELLGWSPQIRHEEGVRRAVEWYLQNRDWAKDIVTG